MIELTPHGDIGFICLLGEGGSAVSSQTGGYACDHPVQGGVIEIISIDLDPAVREFFAGPEGYSGWCNEGMKVSDAVILRKLIPGFELDLDHLDISQEAWVYGHYNDMPCLLVFDNSD
jgi:hypothetical protein